MLDLGEEAYSRWGGVCRRLGQDPICSCGATIDTYGDSPCAGRQCEGFRKIEETVRLLVAEDPRNHKNNRS